MANLTDWHIETRINLGDETATVTLIDPTAVAQSITGPDYYGLTVTPVADEDMDPDAPEDRYRVDDDSDADPLYFPDFMGAVMAAISSASETAETTVENDEDLDD